MKNTVARDLLATVSSIEMTPLAFIELPPHVVKGQVVLHELIILPSKLLEDRVRHQVDGSAVVDEHHRDRPSVDMTLNV
jgi:hypothetical protein